MTIQPVAPGSPDRVDPAAVLSPEAIAAIAAGVPDGTREAYRAAVEDFARWCRSTGRIPLPATSETLTEYGTHLAYERRLAPSTIEKARWAIRRLHRAARQPVPDSGDLAIVLKGYKAALAEAKDPKARPRRATPATRDTLSAIVGRLDRTSLAGCRDAALVLVGFAVAGRRSELAALDIPDVTDTDHGVTVSVYRRKTRTMQEVAIPYASDPELCPVLAVREWIAMLGLHGRTDGPLWVRIDRHGNLGPDFTRAGSPIGDRTGRMTAQAVGHVVGRKARKAGLPGRWTGHSLRRGMATESRRAGHDRLRIARQGGWDDNSAVVAGYMEDADQWTDNALKGVL